MSPSVAFDALFHPRTVAVVGVENTPGTNGALRWNRVRAWAERVGGAVVPIGDRAVGGLPAYRSVAACPADTIDQVIVLTNDLAGRLDGIADKGVSFLVNALAEDRSEYGPEVEATLAAAVEGTGIRLFGPTNVSHLMTFRTDRPGRPIAVITQSGFQGQPLYAAQDSGLCVSHWAATGSESDVEAAEIIEYYAGLPGLGAIAASLEGFESGHTLLRAATTAARAGVPIVMVKVGQTDLGKSWAQTHTGRLAGDDHIVSAALGQYGVIRVAGLDDLLATSMLFARSGPPLSDDMCVCSLSGGNSAHLGDLMRAAGLYLPFLSEATQTRLRQWIPRSHRVDNPVDTGAPPVTDDRCSQILQALLDDPAVGILVVAISAPGAATDRLVRELAELAGRTDKLVCLAWGAPVGDEYYGELMRATVLPVFQSYATCITALTSYLDFHAFRERLPELAEHRSLPTPAGAVETLDEYESKQLLLAYGIPTTDDRRCGEAAAACTAAAALGGSVVVKALSPDIPHKTELGLVRIGVRSASEVEQIYREFEDVVSSVQGCRWRGVLVSEQVEDGIELAVGLSQDAMFGPVVMVGFGGVAMEIYRDVAFRVVPFSRAEARRMFGELVGMPRLTGFRGAKPADTESLLDAVMAVQRIALDGAAVELDINPLLARPDGVVALDALVRVRSAGR